MIFNLETRLLKMNIKRMIEEDNRIGNFINGEFLSYAEQNNVDLNYNEFCFIAETEQWL